MRREFGSIVELEKGKRYQVFWTAGGKRRSKRVSGTRKDASDYLAKVQSNVIGASADITYNQYWNTVVLPSFDGLAEKTVYEYERLWRVELQPRIGSYKVAATKYRNAQAVIDCISSATVQKKCRLLWHRICNMAIRDELLSSNPLQAVTTRKHELAEKNLPTRDEVLELLDIVQGIKYEPLILCSLGMGLRPEESYALDWEDLTFEDGFCTASICKTIVTVNGKAVMQDRTKTASSKREAMCGGIFAERLNDLSSGKTGALCPSVNGHASPQTISHNWRQWCSRNGAKYISFEHMRSCYKTHAAAALIPAELVRLQMGHSGVGVAEQHYLVANKHLLRTVATMFAEYFAPHRTE